MVEQRLVNAGLGGLSGEPVFRLLEGHVYVNTSLIQQVMREVPSLLLTEGVLGLLPEELRGPLRANRRSLVDPRTLATALRLTWRERSWTPGARARLFDREVQSIVAELGDFRVPDGLEASEIATRFALLQKRLGGYLDAVSWAMIYSYLSFHLFAHLSRSWAPSENALSLLGAGVSEIKTFRIHEMIANLAARVREDPDLSQAVLSTPPEDVLAEIRAGGLGAFGEDFASLCRIHGHRLLSRDLAYPSWRERPAAVLEMIQSLARGPAAVSERNIREVQARLREELGEGLRGRSFQFLLRWCQEYYAIRENMRYYADYFLFGMRALALAGAVDLKRRGILYCTEDVFYLDAGEMDLGLRGGAGCEDLRETAALRRREYEQYRKREPAEVRLERPGELLSGGGQSRGLERKAPSRCFQAKSVGPGAVEGVLRVVRSAAELDEVRSGEIVVAKATDPAWTSYISLASGLILEVGGLLSHGAIIARELGIPAVVDLSEATNLFRTGERVRLDGSAGTVERLS